MQDLTITPTDFVSLVNQTLAYAYPSVTIEGELANLKVSKNRWVYFDIKDDLSSVRCFGTVYILPGPLEDGMSVRIRAIPKLHQQFGFSLTVQSIAPVGEGTIKRAQDMLKEALTKEGLFDVDRKRALPYPPNKIGLITSLESAAYADFTKILAERWGGIDVLVHDVQVQGESAPESIVRAIEFFNSLADPPEVLVITRGGGSADDLFAFSTEQVVRAVSASRVPTLVAIGHEIDRSLAELAADKLASTPSNAAQILVPEKGEALRLVQSKADQLGLMAYQKIAHMRQQQEGRVQMLHSSVTALINGRKELLASHRQLLEAYNPAKILKRGYAIVRVRLGGKPGLAVTSHKQVSSGSVLDIEIADESIIEARVT